jgi:hypothetical protein
MGRSSERHRVHMSWAGCTAQERHATLAAAQPSYYEALPIIAHTVPERKGATHTP